MNNPVLISEHFDRAVGHFSDAVGGLRSIGLDETARTFAQSSQLFINDVSNLLRVWGQIQAKIVQVESMKAHDRQAMSVGSGTYTESAYNLVAAEIETLALEIP